MSKSEKANLEVLSADLAKRVDRVNDMHSLVLRNAKVDMTVRFLIGYEMVQLKPIAGHGNWEAFRAIHFKSIPARTAVLYVSDAEAILKTRPKLLTEVKLDQLQLTNGELPEDQEDKLVKALAEVYDGKSATEWRRTVGLARPVQPDGGIRPNAEAVEKFLVEHSPEDKGKKFGELSEPLKKKFLKAYKPKIDAELKAKADAEAYIVSAEDWMETHDAGKWAAADHKFLKKLSDFMTGAQKEIAKALKPKGKK